MHTSAAHDGEDGREMHVTHWRWILLFVALVVITGGRQIPWPASAGMLAILGIVAIYSAWRAPRRTPPGQVLGDVVWRGQRIARTRTRRSLTMGQIAHMAVRLTPGIVLMLLALAQFLRGIGW
jgi:hypothetical protein